MKKLLLHQKPCMILLALRDSAQEWYPSKLAHKAGVTYVYTIHVMGEMEKKGLVTFEKKGRTKMIKLTERGIIIATALEELIRKLETPSLSLPEKEPEKKKEDRDVL